MPISGPAFLQIAAVLWLVSQVPAGAQEPGAPMHVILVLRTQPQREVMDRIERATALRREIAEREHRFQAASGGTFLRQARTELDAAILDSRRVAAAEIARLIEPEQRAVVARLEELGADRVRRFTSLNMVAATIPAAALPSLQADPRIVAIEEDGTGEGGTSVSVPALGAPAMWSAGFTGAGGSLAIADTGIRTNHPFFAGVNIVSHVSVETGSGDPCFADDALSPQDMTWHGTHVAAIAASHGATNYPFFGVAKGIDTIYNLKVLFKCNDVFSGRYWDSDVIAGFEWLVANTPVRVVNFSAGSNNPGDTLLTRFFDNLADTYGLFISLCAGNNGASGATTVWSPAVSYNGVAVANVDDRRTADRSDDDIFASSSRGPTVQGRSKPDIAAPGTGIRSANYLWESAGSALTVTGTGTSMASPHIAGAAALLQQCGITEPLAQKALLINTTGSPGWRPDWGWGYVDLAKLHAQPFSFVDSLADNSTVLFRGVPRGDVRATLTWPRHVVALVPKFNPLRLGLYRAADGSLLGSSADPLQNVQQVSAATSGEVVLAVSGAAAEKFGLAVSDGSFRKASAPALSVSCAPPPGPFATATVAVPCTVTNGGELTAFDVTGTMNPGGASRPVGPVPPGGSASLTWTVPSPAPGGFGEFQVTVGSSSFGQSFSAATSYSVLNSSSAVIAGVSGAAAGLTNVAPGALASIYGSGLSLATAQAAGFPLPSTLGGAWVTVNGVPAPLLYVSPLQINFQVPYEIQPGQAVVSAGVTGTPGASSALRITQAAPEIFVSAVQNQDYSTNDAAHPAAPGSVVIVYFTGQGQLDHPVATGAAAAVEPLSRAVLKSSATIGGVPAVIEFIGMTPFYAGLAQANLRVPDLAPGAAPVVITIAGASSNGPPVMVK